MKDYFDIHYSFILLMILIILMGYINIAIMFLIILTTHELGHIITIKLFKYKIKGITLHASGGLIKTNININIESHKLFLISVSGVLFQIILLLLTPPNHVIFKLLNKSLIMYNLLPIYPLDGYKILLSFIEYYYCYSIIIKISYIISILTLIVFLYISKNIFIFLTLYILNMRYIIEYRYYYEQFLLERYLYGTKYKHKKVISNINRFYKCRNNCILCGNILKEEKEYLSSHYAYFIDISRYF